MKRIIEAEGNCGEAASFPIRNIDHGTVTTEFVAALLINKYCDHLPIHRQVGRLLKSSKVEIAESSICRWRDQIADPLENLAGLMKHEIKQSYCINTDASPAPVPKESGCNAHCRRNFVKAADDEPEWVKRFAGLCKKLYKIEAEIKNAEMEERYGSSTWRFGEI